ncbi:unnamed protein product [Paramecium sonneborni]|uniref:Vta1/callose synthase N-terminal domain-containing protein n=1 Tax=Paramecium sonneborni TaxID=65129 RepID=A0A8S1N6X5_9CILI|nr:unnamed protein product [Paramecium sonneborni]
MLLLGDQIKQINPPMAYYIKYFAIKKVLSYINSNFKVPNFIILNKQITIIRQEIDLLKKQNEKRFQSFEVDMRNIEDSALRLFNHIDDLERQGQDELCSSFIFAVHLFSILSFFKPLRDDFHEKKKYSQYKAIEQYNKMESSGIYINNQKINLKVFVESYLFDLPTENICNQPHQPALLNSEAPKIGKFEWKKTQELEKYENLEKETKTKIRAAISELDFKQYKNAQQQIFTAIDLLNNLLK